MTKRSASTLAPPLPHWTPTLTPRPYDDTWQVVKRISRITDEETSKKRMHEGYELIDELLAPGPDGQLPELWEMGQRKPKEAWAMHMQLTFSLCTGIVRIMTQLVGGVSQRLHKR